MRKNKVKELWKQGKAPTFAWVAVPDTYTAEMLANVGFDAIALDMQHGMTISPEQAGRWFQTVNTTDSVPFVRVPWNKPEYIQWVLDAGAYGVIVPLVNNREEAAKAGGACRYPPLGYRSVGANRVRFFAGADYMEHANEEVICLVMIENIKAVEQIDDIATAPGIDGFYIGPGDLAMTMNIPAATVKNNAEHAAACAKVLAAAKKHGLIPGIHTGTPPETLKRQAEGFMFCPCFGQANALTVAAGAALQKFRAAGK